MESSFAQENPFDAQDAPGDGSPAGEAEVM